jgi:two-component system response regulator HydG
VLQSISADARRALLAFDWPGNVRQLENCIERAVALARGAQIEIFDLPERIVKHTGSSDRADELDLEHVLTLQQLEQRQIERALRRFAGNKTKAAIALGIDRRTLYRKLERWGQVGSRALSPGKAVLPAA